jgi:hypothetical protein
MKIKQWVISQECFFFNAFELGAESENQVILSDDASSS